jgi:hypothetical protein
VSAKRIGPPEEPGSKAANSSIDETLILENLKLTPAERLRKFQISHSRLARLRGAAADARADRH